LGVCYILLCIGTLLWEVYLKWVGCYSRQDLQFWSDPRN